MQTSLDIYHEKYPNTELPAFAYTEVELLREVKFVHGEPEQGVNIDLDKVVGLYSSHIDYFRRGFTNEIQSLNWLQLLNKLRRVYKYAKEDIAKIDDNLINSTNVLPWNKDCSSIIYLVSEDKHYISSGLHRITLLKFRADKPSFYCKQQNIHFAERS
ncbi:hypothetical protein [Spirosoma flavum]|uniref:Uncharacterized protein n=1 Tax=Spirosoma flavum TaxID=2048557 RepID=A0ABW6AUK6_9BACT